MNSSLDWLIYPQDSQELDPEKMTYETTNHQQRPKSVAVINSGAKEWFEVHTRMGTESVPIYHRSNMQGWLTGTIKSTAVFCLAHTVCVGFFICICHKYLKILEMLSKGLDLGLLF